MAHTFDFVSLLFEPITGRLIEAQLRSTACDCSLSFDAKLVAVVLALDAAEILPILVCGSLMRILLFETLEVAGDWRERLLSFMHVASGLGDPRDCRQYEEHPVAASVRVISRAENKRACE